MGAEQINLCVLNTMKQYMTDHPEILHIHASGSLEYPASKAMFESLGLNAYDHLQLAEYIYDMPQKMAAADLVISRAGSMTLSELALQRKPCILIPSPNVTNNHQYKNAKVLADRGAAILIEEKDLTPKRLWDTITDLFTHRDKMERMKEAIGEMAVPDANEKIYRSLRELVDEKKKK